MPLLRAIARFYIPMPLRELSHASKKALQLDLADADAISGLSDAHRQRVDVWTRHSDNAARTMNTVWFAEHGSVYVRRWGVLLLAATVAYVAVRGTPVVGPVIALIEGMVAFGFLVTTWTWWLCRRNVRPSGSRLGKPGG